MIFKHLPLWLQKLACFGAVIVFILRYRYSKKFRDDVLKALGQLRAFIPALFKKEAVK
jgi:hypothetical protein